MKVTIDYDLSKLAATSNKNIMKYFDGFMEDCCEAKEQEEYMRLLKCLGKWIDEAREGYGIK